MANVVGTTNSDFIHVAGDGITQPGGTLEIASATDGDDTISSGSGGTDYIYAGGGFDVINFYGDLTAADRIDGGASTIDTLDLHNSVNVIFTAAGLRNVERIILGVDTIPSGQFGAQSLTFVDANFAAESGLTIDATAATADEFIFIDASQETDVSLFNYLGGASSDTVLGPRNVSASGTIDFSEGGGDDSFTGAGQVRFSGLTFNSADRVNGLGVATLQLVDGFTGTITAAMVQNVADFYLFAGGSYDIQLDDGVIAAGETLNINGFPLFPGNGLTLRGEFETNGNIIVYAGSGDDVIFTGAGDDIIILGAGVNGAAWGDDQANAGGGDDIVQVNSVEAGDVLEGGAGRDTLIIANTALSGTSSGSSVTLGVSVTGFEIVQVGQGPNTVGIHNVTILDAAVVAGGRLRVDGSFTVGTLQVSASSEMDGTLDIVGGRGDDSLGAGRGDDTLFGGAGNDVLTGNTGADFLDGGAGADRLRGGAGGDTYVVDNVADVIVETSDASRDLVRTSISWVSLAANVESLQLTGAANIAGAGNGLDNTLIGNTGNNVLNGMNGDDKINGGAGNDDLKGSAGHDTLTGGLGKDHFILASTNAADSDTITDFSSVDDSIYLDNATLTNVGANGALTASFFRANTTGFAQDADDHIIYDTSTGELFYDANGNVAGGRVLIATLTGQPAVTLADFVVI